MSVHIPLMGLANPMAILRYQNLAGLGDRLQASAYRSTTGGAYAYDLAYQIPITPQNSTLLLRLAPNNYRITDTSLPEFNLGLSGSSDSHEILVRQPLIRTTEEDLALSAGFRYRQGSTLLLGFITPPTVTSVISFGQDYVRRDDSRAWGVQSKFRLGTCVGGSGGVRCQVLELARTGAAVANP